MWAKVRKLSDTITKRKLQGTIGIAHTRWATHGKPSVKYFHPHSSQNEIAIVHNGIIENRQLLRFRLTEEDMNLRQRQTVKVIAHLIHHEKKNGKVSFLKSVIRALGKLKGAYGICAIDNSNRDQIIICEEWFSNCHWYRYRRKFYSF